MASLVKTINEHVDYFYSLQGKELNIKNIRQTNLILDPRTKDWFLLERPPYTIIGILILYFILVKYGTKWMEKREPYELKFLMTVYNLVQVVTPFVLIPYVI